MANAAFSEDGKYFSTISKDGRLRIWDTDTNVLKQEYTPDLHLTSPPSCLQWITASESSTFEKNGQQRTRQETNQCIALGTKSGKILIYSVSQAKVQSVLVVDENNISKNRNIVSLDWHRKYGLYSCDNESLVHEWDLEKGEFRNKYNVNVVSKIKVSNVSAIKIIPHNQKTTANFLVTSSTQVRVWCLHNGDAELVKVLGHNATPEALLALATHNNTCWLLHGSKTERLLSFWDVTVTSEHKPLLNGDDNHNASPNKKKRKKSTSAPVVIDTPSYIFVLEDAPQTVDINAKDEDGCTTLSVVAATKRSGVVHYYRHLLNGKASKPIKPSVTIQVCTEEAEPMPPAGCRLVDDDIILGYNYRTLLFFERVTPDLKTQTQTLIRGDDRRETKNKNKDRERGKEQAEATKVRSDTAPEVTYVEPLGGVTRKRPTAGATVEVTMEQRLSNLTVDVKVRGRSAVSHNLTKLLMQGLHSKDNKLIMMVLQNNNSSVAIQTVSALPAEYMPMLLEKLADIATRKTSQCASVCTWLSAVIRCHSALLLATCSGPTSNHLTQLLAIFTQRRSHLCQLLNLKGRVELTTQQRMADDIEKQQAVLDYNDTSSDSEIELEQPSDVEEDADQSWSESNSVDADSDVDE